MTLAEWKPATATELSRMMAENARNARTPLVPCGGRTGLRFGGSATPGAALVSTTELNQVIDYPARDMTITVEAGMRVEELQKILAEQRQRLPIDIPQANRATLGGAIAANVSGPSRFGYGTFRDFLIGMSAVDGQGRLFSAGGRVVKNVAGYDLCKLMIGSLGTLGVITQATLKVLPIPESRAIVLASVPSASAMDALLIALNTSATRPVVQDVLNPKAAVQIRSESKREFPLDEHLLCLAYEGGQAEIEWQVETVSAEIRATSGLKTLAISDEPASLFWKALCEYQAASDDPLTFKASVPLGKLMAFIEQATSLNVAVQAHAGNGVVIGHLPDRCTTARLANEILKPLRETAVRNGGSLAVLNCDDDWNSELDLFGPASPAWKLMRELKQALDPAQVLCPGRLWEHSLERVSK